MSRSYQTLTPREWSQQYETIKRQIQSKRSQGQLFTSSECSGIKSVISGLDSSLEAMSLSPMENDITASELARRRVLIDNLKKQVLSSPTNRSSNYISQPDTRDVIDPSSSTHLTSEKGLALRQIDIMKQQDEMLSDIGDGVDRLHQRALLIGEETKIHVRLLDDLDSNVDMATSALQAETKHAERIKESTRVCYMYICVGIEILLIVILLIVALH